MNRFCSVVVVVPSLNLSTITTHSVSIETIIGYILAVDILLILLGKD
jgi:hypothetical protein